MTQTASQIGTRVWAYAGVLADDGLSYMEYVEQLTFLLFLKMAHEREEIEGGSSRIPKQYAWPSLTRLDGPDLYAHYQETLQALSRKPGLLGTVFKEAECRIKDPARLRKLIVDLIGKETWLSLSIDVKGVIYEELLARSASESSGGAGQYFTPRPIISSVVEVMRPAPDDTIMDPAAGTGGFLTVAYDRVIERHGASMNRNQKRSLPETLVTAQELVPVTARLCAMNLFLHGLGSADSSPVISGVSSLDQKPERRFSMVLANPPFGKKQSLKTVTTAGELETKDEVIVRDDFWVSTANKQLNFVQHIFNLLKVEGRAAVVIPDNVLFEGGPGQTIRDKLLHQCDVHTLLRLPTGIFYKPGVKANVLFFDRKPPREEPWTERLWVYDLRTNRHFTQKKNPIADADFEEFNRLYEAEDRGRREATWSESNPEGRWRSYGLDELRQRDKLSFDLFWIRDETLEDSASLPDPDVLAAEIVDDLQTALEEFAGLAEALGEVKP